MKPPNDSSPSSLGKWMMASVLCIPLVGLTTFYGLLHIGFGVPLSRLVEPFGVVAALVLLFGPLMYWAATHTWLFRDFRKRMILVATGFLWLLSMVGIHYSGELHIMAREDMLPTYGITSAIVALGVF